MLLKTSSFVLVTNVLLALAGCSGSSDNSSNVGKASDDGGSTSDSDSSASAKPDLLGDIPAGSVTAYGAVTVGDDAGIASDLVASFFELEEGLSGDYLKTVFSSSSTLCTVDDYDVIDFEDFSAGFIPSLNGVEKQAISAGESITLTSDSGTFANIQPQSVGAFLFYTLPDMQMLPSAPVPQSLRVDFAGDVFPGYQAASLPSVEPLSEVEFTGGDMIIPTSTFSWSPPSNPGSMIRIFTSTRGGFFLEDGKTVTCLAPDTGSFTFPLSVQTELGANFEGGMPIFSRVSVRAETTENSILFLIRESFTD